MKKTLSILSLVLCISILSCKKDTAVTPISNVSSTFKMVLWEYTATWCGPCGSNAFPAFDATNKNNESYVCGISMHPSDGVSSGSASGQSELKTFFGFGGTPQAAINFNKKFGFGSNAESNKTTLQNHANTAKTVKAKAGIGISKSVVGNSLEIQIKTVIFEDLTGDYNIAVYVIENGLAASQTGHTPNLVTHNHVYRGTANGVWGKKLAGNLTKSRIIDDSFAFPIPNDVKNRDNLQVVAVIWKMDGTTGPIDIINSNKN